MIWDYILLDREIYTTIDYNFRGPALGLSFLF